MSDQQPAVLQPLSSDKWARLHQLIAFGQLTPEQHAEAADLHAQAKAAADHWQPDAEMASAHLLAVVDGVSLALRQIASLVPSAAGMASIVQRVEDAVAKFKGATVPPPQPPEFPPEPESEPAPVVPELPPPAAPEPVSVLDPTPPPVAPPTDPADSSANTLNTAEADQNAVSAPPAAQG